MFLIIIMLLQNQQNMKRIIEETQLLTQIDRYGITKQFQLFFDNWNIQKRYKYLSMSPGAILQVCRKINYRKEKAANSTHFKKTNLWIKGQFKLFVWVSAFYLFNNQLSIRQLKNRDFQTLAAIFVTKSIERMKYQLKGLTATQRYPKRKWDRKEVGMLKQLLEKYITVYKRVQWKSIAFELFYKSEGKNFRTFGQCREMWANHLNQTVSKKKWTQQQDQLLLQLAKETNRRWSKISERFGGSRSGHMIKNRYWALSKREAIKGKGFTEKKELELNQALTNAKQNQVVVFSSNPLDTCSIIQSQNLGIQRFISQEANDQKFIDQLLKQNTQEAATQKLKFEAHSQHGPSFSKEIKDIKSFADYDFAQMVQFFTENHLIQQLGCSHFQQVQLALEQQPDIPMEMDE